MRVRAWVGSLVVLSFCMPASALGQSAPETAGTSPAAAEYLNAVLDLMQKNALHTKEIDWPAVRRETLEHAKGAQKTVDTYPAIYYAFTQLKEHHSFLMLPDGLPQADKQRAQDSFNAIVGPYRKQVSQPPVSPFRDRKEISGRLIRVGNQSFAYVVIPECGGRHAKWEDNIPDFQKYADTLHVLAAGLATQHPDGWIIDLRGNGGGNMWPMLAGIGFVLGEGRIGYFLDSSGEETPWFYRAGKAGTVDGNVESESAGIKSVPFALPDMPPVAVLVDSGTGSSGEATAIAFAGRAKTRSFGTHTYGLTSSNQNFPLSDGAMLFLATGVEADRTNHVYENGIEPDVSFPEPPMLPTDATDTVLQAAESWLGSISARSAYQ
jgi:carboxyl-terminal processing protease